MKFVNNGLCLLVSILIFSSLVSFSCKGTSTPKGTQLPDGQAIGGPGIVSMDQDLPVAIVSLSRSEPIAIKQLRQEVERIEQQTRRTMSQIDRFQVLDVMINQRLVLQAAEQAGVFATEDEINQMINRMKVEAAQQSGWSMANEKELDQKFEEFMRRELGISLSAFRTQIKNNITLEKYLRSKKRIETPAPPTSKDVQDYYDLNRTKLVRPDTVQVALILVPVIPAETDDQASVAEKSTKAERLANEIHREITNYSDPAEKFDEIVTDRARGERQGYMAGMGSFIPRTEEVQNIFGADYVNAIFSLRQAQVSRVLKTPRGYELVKVMSTLRSKILDLNDIIEPGTNRTVRQYITEGLTAQRSQEVMEKAQQELIAELRKDSPFEIFEERLNW